MLSNANICLSVMNATTKGSGNRGRHESQCSVCQHEQRKEIDRAFRNWTSPDDLAKQYGLSRDAIYRHAHATTLFEARGRNLKMALGRIIEKAADAPVNAAAVVSAVQAYAKINAQGQWIDRTENVNLSDLFERMTEAELKRYAEEGKLPEWFPVTGVGATSPEREPVEEDAENVES
jgi:hypothetical protein